MPYTDSHWLITVGGDSWLQTETWQFGVRATAAFGFQGEADQQLLANALATPTANFFASINPINQCRMLWLKAAAIKPDGHYLYSIPPGTYNYSPANVGTANVYMAPQVTLAVTTLTSQARGRAARGRFYLPPILKTMQTDGRISAAEADAVEGVAKTWLLAINATAQVDNVAVMSKLGTGTTNVVNAVGVGRVMDTMRSRRRSLAEGRTPLAL